MQDLYQEDLTEELIERLSKEITFMDPVNLRKYDTITIMGETIELYHEEYEKVDDFDYINKSYSRNFKRNNMTGVYIEY